MSEEVEKIIKIKGIINSHKYHLSVTTDFENNLKWQLFLKIKPINDYLSNDNFAILESGIDKVEDLIKYLKSHHGLIER